MKYRYLLLLWLGAVPVVQAQTDPQVSNQFDDLLKVYQSTMEQFMNVQGCGHALDGPAFFIKRLENTSLDALLSLDEAEEMEMGAEVLKKIKESKKLLGTHENMKEAKGILQKIQAHVSRSGITYQLHVIDSEELNAFATIGGHIFLTTGIFEFIDTLDELAFIIGHEVAHIDRYHTLRKQKKLLLASSFAQFVDLEHLTRIALDFNLMISAPFDQMDEYEADRFGADLAKKAGFNTANFSDFFTKMSQHQNKNVLNKIMRTHPYADDRVACLTEYLEDN